MTGINRIRCVAAALAAALFSMTLPAAAAPPDAKADINGKTVYLVANSWLRYGPSLLDKVYTTTKVPLELKGRGECTVFACPLVHNGVNVFARRSKLELAKPSGLVGIHRTLRRGDEGTDVKAAQEALIKAGFKLVADGKFGSGTETAVKEFQRKNKLQADGAIGQETRNKLGIA